MACASTCACDDCMVRGIGGAPNVGVLVPAVPVTRWLGHPVSGFLDVLSRSPRGSYAGASFAVQEASYQGGPVGSVALASFRRPGAGDDDPPIDAPPPRDPWHPGPQPGPEPGSGPEPGPDPYLGILAVRLRTVDIYMSAGPKNGDLSCDPLNETNCSLYRVRVRLPESTPGSSMLYPRADVLDVVERELVVPGNFDGSGISAVQPAVSPSGEKLAWIARSDNPKYTWLWASSPPGSGFTIVTEAGRAVGDAPTLSPNFPNWYDEQTLLYHAGEEYEKTLYSVAVSGTATLTFSLPSARLGKEAATATSTTFADANTRHPRDVSLDPYNAIVDFGELGRDIVTFGYLSNDSADGSPLQPRVHSLTESPYTFAEEFVLGETNYYKTNGGAPPLRFVEECHHPAWNISGDKILCSALEPDEPWPAGDASTTRHLYMFQRNGNVWTSDGQLAFTPLTPTELNDQFGDAVIPPETLFFVYKYAEWCADDNFVVATLYCREVEDAEAEVLSSRVILIQRSPVRYFDLTAEIEDLYEKERGSYRGIYSTCHEVTE